jgi:hypothetical protein
VVDDVRVSELAATDRYLSSRLDQIAQRQRQVRSEHQQVAATIAEFQEKLDGLQADLTDLEQQAEFVRAEKSELHRRMAEHVVLPSSGGEDHDQAQTRTTRERIVEVLSTVSGPMPMAEVVRLVREGGSSAKDATIREVLLKMHERDEVKRPRRSMYELTRKLRAV